MSNGVTSSAGFYRTFEGLPTGTYFARTANSAGYVNGLYAGIGCSGACVPTAGTPISVTAGSTRAGVNFASTAARGSRATSSRGRAHGRSPT